MDLWNRKDLPIPPVSSYKTSAKEIDLTDFKNSCTETRKFFDAKGFIHAEYLLLSRIIYRMKQKFRSSKDFKTIEKICKCLKTFFDTDVISHLETLIYLIPDRYKQTTYLPSKNLLDFLLIRFQGISKLLDKVVSICIEAAELLFTRIKIGHFWKIGFIAYSVIARLYVLAKHATNKVCEFYNRLLPLSKKLECTNNWLPISYELPADLKAWLNSEWLELEDVKLIDISAELPGIIPFFNLVEDEDDDDIQFCEEYILINDSKREEKPDLLSILRGFDRNNDVGEVIDLKEDNIVNRFEPMSVDVGEIIEIDEKRLIRPSNSSKRKKRFKGCKEENVIEVIELCDENEPQDSTDITGMKKIKTKHKKSKKNKEAIEKINKPSTVKPLKLGDKENTKNLLKISNSILERNKVMSKKKAKKMLNKKSKDHKKQPPFNVKVKKNKKSINRVDGLSSSSYNNPVASEAVLKINKKSFKRKK